VQAWTGSSSGFVLIQVRGLFLEVVVLVVGLESLQEVSLLGVLPLVLNTGMGGAVALRWRGGRSTVFLLWFWSSYSEREMVPS
jgi:hypothetical protein